MLLPVGKPFKCQPSPHNAYRARLLNLLDAPHPLTPEDRSAIAKRAWDTRGRSPHPEGSPGPHVPESVQDTLFATGMDPATWHAHAVRMTQDLDAAHADDPTWTQNVAAVQTAMQRFPMIHAAQLGNIPIIAQYGLVPAAEFHAGLAFDKISGLDRTVFMRMGQAGGGGHGAVGVMVDPTKLDTSHFIVTKLGAMTLKEDEEAILKTPGDHSALVDAQLAPFRETTIPYDDLPAVQSRLLVHGYEKDHPGTRGTAISPEQIVSNDHGEMEVKYAGHIPPEALVAFFAGDQPLSQFGGLSAYDYLRGKVPAEKLVKYAGEGLHPLSAAYRAYYASPVQHFAADPHPLTPDERSEIAKRAWDTRGRTTIGITSQRSGAATKPNRLVFQEMHAFAGQLQRLPGVTNATVTPGVGVWQDFDTKEIVTEPSWVVSYNGDGDALRLVAQTGKTYQQQAVLVTRPPGEAGLDAPVVEFAFDTPLSLPKQKALIAAMTKHGITGATWSKRNEKTVMRAVAVPQWGMDAANHLRGAREISDELTARGLTHTTSIDRVAVDVLEESGSHSYDTVLTVK